MLINTEQPVPGIRVGADPKELGIDGQLRLWLLSVTVHKGLPHILLERTHVQNTLQNANQNITRERQTQHNAKLIFDQTPTRLCTCG